MSFALRFANNQVVTFDQPIIMGIINVSPNSFYQPHMSIDAVLTTAEQMIADGAAILDIGGEATNPFVDVVKDSPSQQIELDRVVPAVSAIRERFEVLVSVDTSRAVVMRESIAVGADMVNDQRALHDDHALTAVAALKTPVSLMHFFYPARTPGSQDLPSLLTTVKSELQASVERCLAAGISHDRIIIDPGFGGGNFGKNAAENYYLLTHLNEFVAMGFPVLSGWSRKSMIGDVLQVPPTERLFGSIAADTLATYQGAAIIRSHDVKASHDAMMVATQCVI